jgi:hypothetical protein
MIQFSESREEADLAGHAATERGIVVDIPEESSGGQ